MFLGKMSGVFSSDLFSFGTTDCLTKIRQHLGSRFVICRATRINKLPRFAKPFLRFLDHFLHPIMSLTVFLDRFTFCSGFPFLLLPGVVLGSHCFGLVE